MRGWRVKKKKKKIQSSLWCSRWAFRGLPSGPSAIKPRWVTFWSLGRISGAQPEWPSGSAFHWIVQLDQTSFSLKSHGCSKSIVFQNDGGHYDLGLERKKEWKKEKRKKERLLWLPQICAWTVEHNYFRRHKTWVVWNCTIVLWVGPIMRCPSSSNWPEHGGKDRTHLYQRNTRVSFPRFPQSKNVHIQLIGHPKLTFTCD